MCSSRCVGLSLFPPGSELWGPVSWPFSVHGTRIKTRSAYSVTWSTYQERDDEGGGTWARDGPDSSEFDDFGSRLWSFSRGFRIWSLNGPKGLKRAKQIKQTHSLRWCPSPIWGTSSFAICRSQYPAWASLLGSPQSRTQVLLCGERDHLATACHCTGCALPQWLQHLA